MQNLALRPPARSSWVSATAIAATLAIAAIEASAARLCLTSTQLPFAKGDPRISMLEEKIATRLEEGHFSVVRGQSILDVLEQVDETSGKVFDASTGEVIPERLGAYHAELGRVLREKLGCEGRLRIRVESLLARLHDDSAVWDGARVRILQQVAIAPTPQMRGWVSALSLWVELVDIEGREVAFRSGAIEPLIHKAAFSPVDLLPDDRWLSDERIVDAAIERTLGPKALYLRDRGNPSWRFPESPLVWPAP